MVEQQKKIWFLEPLKLHFRYFENTSFPHTLLSSPQYGKTRIIVGGVTIDRRGNFDRLGSFVKGARVPIHECLFLASAFMEIKDWHLGLRIYMLLRPCLRRSNLKTSRKFAISWKNWRFYKTVLKY